jgi:cytoskeletal protein CcmA (bactofilin family)
MKNLSTMTSLPEAAPRMPVGLQKPDSQPRKLVVGNGIVFSGKINSCDCLVVEGTVNADITGCKDIQVAKGGVFIGSAASENADIQGRFEGELKVSQRLTVQATGEVAAKVRYHQIQVECGGDISGDIAAEGRSKPTLARSA